MLIFSILQFAGKDKKNNCAEASTSDMQGLADEFMKETGNDYGIPSLIRNAIAC